MTRLLWNRDVHIFTRSKVPWLTLPESTPAFTTYYDTQKLWPAAESQSVITRRFSSRADGWVKSRAPASYVSDCLLPRVNSLQCPSETTSTVPSTTLMAV